MRSFPGRPREPRVRLSGAKRRGPGMDGARKIEDQAAQWLVRRDQDTWSESDQGALDRWLEESTAHVVAYVRLQAAWQETRRLKSLGAGVKPGVVPSPDEWTLSPIFTGGATAADAPPVWRLRKRAV